MEVSSAMLPPGWLAAGQLALVLVLAGAIRTAAWRKLRDPEMQHAWFGAMVALMLLWWIRAGIVPGLGFHFFGVTTLTLMFGWQFACLAAPAVLSAGILTGHGDWSALGINALLLFCLPAGISWAVHQFASRRLPWNFFIYVFINCYLAAALAMLLATVAMAAVLVSADAVAPSYLFSDYLPFLPMLLLSEGFINGMVITMLVATRPAWVWTFDDDRYLRRDP